MNIIEYENHDGSIDYAPESFLNVGAYQLQVTEAKEYAVFYNAEKPAETGFSIYPEAK